MTTDGCSRRRVLGSIGVVLAAGTGFVGSSTATDSAELAENGRFEYRNSTQEDPLVDLYEETIDGVVLVQVAGTGPDHPGGLGSGFVYDERHVVTNDHVVRDASTVDLQFSEEDWRSATVVGTDTYSDLAVLEVEDRPAYADALPMTESRPSIGQEVVALGNPLGLDASISQGIVSGIDRSLPSPTGFAIPAAIQTDAPVNPGNSGGPLVNLDGEVTGVVFAGAGQNIGFAIPAALSERVVPSLIEHGQYEHPFLGIGVDPVTPTVAEEADLEDARGVLVVHVLPDSPAAGVFEPAEGPAPGESDSATIDGDVIVEIDDTEIPTQERLSSHLALETAPGDTIEVEVIRDGERETLEVTLGARPPPPSDRETS